MQTSSGNQMVNPSKHQRINNFRCLTGSPNKGFSKIAQLLPGIPGTTNLHLEPDMPNTTRSITDADIPQEARNRLKSYLMPNTPPMYQCQQQTQAELI